MSPNMRQATSLGDRQVPPKPVHCFVKVKPFHRLRRTVAKGKNFENSGWPAATKTHQEIFRSTRFVRLLCASLRVGRCMDFRFGDIPPAQVVFQGHQAGLGAVSPIFAGLEHCEHRKIQHSCQWRSDPKP